MNTIIHLNPSLFSSPERKLVQSGMLSASTFEFPGGVQAVRLVNDVGNLVLLPYQGQQIWSAEFMGRNLTMKSMFDAPRKTQVYLETYGGFLLHCGATAMGVPTGLDTHPLHGELPNAPYQEAQIELGVDEQGEYISLNGKYQHTVAFSYNYIAQPEVRLYAGSSLFRIRLAVMNLKNTEMEFMYLAHINFRPVVNGRLVYTARCTPQTVRVRSSIPSHVNPKPGYREFLNSLSEKPEQHHQLRPDLMFDPEVVFMIDYLADELGWAHSMQVHPDGSADYVSHRPAELDHGIRWICRTPDQEALGLVLPATAEPEGYHAEKDKGNLKIIPPRGSFTCEIIVGLFNAQECSAMERKINQLLKRKSHGGC
jgi:hypothetical protein